MNKSCIFLFLFSIYVQKQYDISDLNYKPCSVISAEHLNLRAEIYGALSICMMVKNKNVKIHANVHEVTWDLHLRRYDDNKLLFQGCFIGVFLFLKVFLRSMHTHSNNGDDRYDTKSRGWSKLEESVCLDANLQQNAFQIILGMTLNLYNGIITIGYI